jgi:uncharacterized protein (DUF305 family)
MRRLQQSTKFSLVAIALLLFITSCATSNENVSKFSNADLMFAEMMIPHHEQAIEMSDLAIEISDNPKILSLARQVKAAQAPEIEQMKIWLDARDSGHMGHDMMEDSNHSGHGMMGMLDEGEISELSRATGVQFDRLFLKGMIAHHEGAIDMAAMVVDSDNEEAAALGKVIIKTQRAEITEMRALLATLS